MKKIITITAIVALILTGCSSNPVADFVFSPSNPVTGEQVHFTNLSLDAELFDWDFGDGTVTSQAEPIHTYIEGGTYTIQLMAYGKRDKVDIYQKSITVISAEPTAYFGIYTDLPTEDGVVPFETDVVFVGEQVEFLNNSIDAIDFLWDFDDGYTSEVESPLYSYDAPGTYYVSLTAYGYGQMQHTYKKKLTVYEGADSPLRITVLEYYDEYPVEGASVILYEDLADWGTQTYVGEEFTTPLGKCVFENLDYQRYYVDVWEKDHDNYMLKNEDLGFVETQVLEPGYIHDFIAYVDYYSPAKKMVFTRLSKKAWAKEQVANKKASEIRSPKENKFSKEN